MVGIEEMVCPVCGMAIRKYDKVKRIIKGDYGQIRKELIERRVCLGCGRLHSVLPKNLLPYKHYEARIIRGFMLNFYSNCDLEYEDYPSDSTIKRWKALPLSLVSHIRISNLE